MAQRKQHTPSVTRSMPELTPASYGDGELVDMREAADVLMEDEGEVVGLLTRAGVSLVRETDATFVARHDLLAFRDREIAAQRAGVREITRLSIAAGLDDVDYPPRDRDR